MGFSPPVLGDMTPRGALSGFMKRACLSCVSENLGVGAVVPATARSGAAGQGTRAEICVDRSFVTLMGTALYSCKVPHPFNPHNHFRWDQLGLREGLVQNHTQIRSKVRN